jgi:hypothetical protein
VSRWDGAKWVEAEPTAQAATRSAAAATTPPTAAKALSWNGHAWVDAERAGSGQQGPPASRDLVHESPDEDDPWRA